MDVDYRLSTHPFKFNRNHDWAMDTHITVLSGATVNTTIELQAYCNDRSNAAQHLASNPLQSNSLVLTLQWERESYLTCVEYQALLQNTGIDTVAHAGNPCTDEDIAASSVTQEMVMDALAAGRLEEFLKQESARQEESSQTSRVQSGHDAHDPSLPGKRSSDTWTYTSYVCDVNSALDVNMLLMHAHNHFHPHSLLNQKYRPQATFMVSESDWLEVSSATALGDGTFSDTVAGAFTDYELDFRFEQRRCLWGACFFPWTTEERHCHCSGSSPTHTCTSYYGH